MRSTPGTFCAMRARCSSPGPTTLPSASKTSRVCGRAREVTAPRGGANLPRTTQSRSDSALACQVKVLKPF